MANEFITAEDILTSSGKYPERRDKADAEIRMNARILAAKVNLLLTDLGWTGRVTVSSGFRPPEVNAAVPGAAKRSLHMRGLAVDLAGQDVGLAIRKHPQGAEFLRKHSLFMEALEATKSASGGWLHLDLGVRKDRESREFFP